MFLLAIMIGKNGKRNDMLDLPNANIKDIILFDSSSNIEDLKKFLTEKSAIVITLDHDAHKTLSKNNIHHEISDVYLTRSDLCAIQKKSYDLVKWYSEQRIVELTEYEGINLGSLIEVEFNYFLVPFLKKFVEISKILAKHREKNFTSSASLYDMTNTFTTSVNILDKAKLPDNKFYYDSIKVTLKLKDHYITLNLPKTYYLKLKNIIEKITHLLFNPMNNDNAKKTILLVEFDTIRYRSIFESSSKTKLKLVLFNRRRPAIWNLESFLIAKKSNSKVVTHFDVDGREMKRHVNDGTSLIKNKIESLWRQEDYFNSFFSINGMSFWKIIKPIFIELVNKRLIEFIPEIELTKKLLQKLKPSAVLLWTETAPTEKTVIKLAKNLKIPIVVLQHGLFFDSEGARDMNQFQGVYPVEADKYVVWGKIEERHAVREGVPKERIAVLGSPLYDNMDDIKMDHKNESFILLATSGPVKEDAFDLTVVTRERNQNTIKKICEVVSKLDKKLVIKLHPSPDEFDPTEIAHQIDPKITIVHTGSIIPLVKLCEAFVVIDVSTVILDAQILGKPVISVAVKDSGWGIPTVLSSNSCIVANSENFESMLKRVLTDDDFKNQAIANGKKFADEYLVNIGSASKEILDLLARL